jgi:hypothetical protein
MSRTTYGEQATSLTARKMCTCPAQGHGTHLAISPCPARREKDEDRETKSVSARLFCLVFRLGLVKEDGNSWPLPPVSFYYCTVSCSVPTRGMRSPARTRDVGKKQAQQAGSLDERTRQSRPGFGLR